MNNSLHDYWAGYNYCKFLVLEFGYYSALAECDYGLSGKSYTYREGFTRYLRFYDDKHADDLMYDRETRC